MTNKDHKLNILRGSYEENMKFYNEICKALPLDHPKREILRIGINDITEKIKAL